MLRAPEGICPHLWSDDNAIWPPLVSVPRPSAPPAHPHRRHHPPIPTHRRDPPSAANSDTAWLCRVKLKREFDETGRKLTEVPPEELFATITHQLDITLCVTAAQVSIRGATLAM